MCVDQRVSCVYTNTVLEKAKKLKASVEGWSATLDKMLMCQISIVSALTESVVVQMAKSEAFPKTIL